MDRKTLSTHLAVALAHGPTIKGKNAARALIHALIEIFSLHDEFR